jgi:hypothetical protein
VLVEVINRANAALEARPFTDRLASVRDTGAAPTGNRNRAA